MARPRYPVVAFDLDGTLLRGTSVSLYLAERSGRGDVLVELERRFRTGEISNREIADVTAGWFAGSTPAAIWGDLGRAPWIGGMRTTLECLSAAGCHIVLGTVTWRFAAELIEREYGFDAVSGTEMGVDGDGTLSGVVTRYFDEYDKVAFVRDWCTANGYSMDQVAAVGDSRSDVPLFESVGFAVALNATTDARAAADERVDTEDLTDVLPLLIDDGAAGPANGGAER